MGMDKVNSSCHFRRMILIPTIELRDQPTSDTLAPALEAQARQLVEIGFDYLYIIDRDAQYGDQPFNIGQVRSFLKIFGDYKIGVGGGIKDIETLDMVFEAGARRVILGPMFWHQEGLFARAAAKYPNQLFALVDAYKGVVHDDIHQMDRHKGRRILDVALKLESEGAGAIVYLERERDSGFYGGIDAEIMADLAFALQVPLYVTGGINSFDHLRALKSQADTGIHGAILGRALLDGRIDPVSALTLLKAED